MSPSGLASGYRSDVDGMRAIAVMAVLLSHLGVGWMGGGYVGVDMFFVISGYVVFGDLMRRAQDGDVSASAFYLRRARRLLPNLTVMTTVVLVVAAAVFLPSDLVRLPGRIAASLLGFANWLFAYQSGYFMPASEWNPLLHTWTLSVEFQFYLFVPLLVFVISRFGEVRFRALIVALTVASFAYAMLSLDDQSSWHFYDTFARVWQFLLGIALQLVRIPRLGVRPASTLGFLALATLLSSFVFLNRDGAYPDLRALPPTIATVMLIAVAEQSTSLRSILGAKAMVSVGKASYSIYIWHWPIIVFVGYCWPALTRHAAFPILLIPPIMLVSMLMYRWVEEPFRSSRKASIRRSAWLVALICVVLTVSSGALLVTRGWPQRFDEQVLALDREEQQAAPRRDECHRSTLEKPLHRSCVFGASVAPTIAVWSDSHGVELVEDLDQGLADRKLSAVLYSFSSCPPGDPSRTNSDCDRFKADVLKRLLTSPQIRTVVLAGATDSPRYYSNPVWTAEFTSASHALLKAGKKLVLIYPIPRQPFHVPRVIANETRFSIGYEDAILPVEQYLKRTSSIFDTYDSLGSRGVTRVYPHRIFCAEGPCRISDGSNPFYFDDNHLTLEGAKLLAEETMLTLP